MMGSFAYAVPAIPDTFFGTVKMDGKNISAGSIITVKVAGEIDSEYIMSQEGEYELTVKKGVFGDEIKFYINNNLFGTRTRVGGMAINYNLSYTTPPKDPPEETKPSSGGGGSFTPKIVNETEENITGPITIYGLSITAPDNILVTQGGIEVTKITIKNTGNGTIENLMIFLEGEVPSSWVLIDPETITKLEPNEEKQIKITFSTPEFSARTYDFKLKATSENVNKAINSVLEVTKANLMNANNIKILSIVPETALIPGKTTRFFVALENTGDKTEYGLLQLNNFGNWNMTPEYKYIGIDAGLQATIIFEVAVPKGAIPETKEITATLIGQSMAKKELTVEVIAEKITATPTGLATGNTASVAAGIVLITLLAGGYFFKRTMKN